MKDQVVFVTFSGLGSPLDPAAARIPMKAWKSWGCVERSKQMNESNKSWLLLLYFNWNRIITIYIVPIADRTSQTCPIVPSTWFEWVYALKPEYCLLLLFWLLLFDLSTKVLRFCWRISSAVNQMSSGFNWSSSTLSSSQNQLSYTCYDFIEGPRQRAEEFCIVISKECWFRPVYLKIIADWKKKNFPCTTFSPILIFSPTIFFLLTEWYFKCRCLNLNWGRFKWISSIIAMIRDLKWAQPFEKHSYKMVQMVKIIEIRTLISFFFKMVFR